MAETIIEKRIRVYRSAVEESKRFTYCVREELGSAITAILFGSYARGDFYEESDIDLLIVVDKPLPLKPHHRIDLLLNCMKKYPRVEPVLLTVEEFERKYIEGNPLAVEAVTRGLFILDELGLKEKTSLWARKQFQAY